MRQPEHDLLVLLFHDFEVRDPIQRLQRGVVYLLIQLLNRIPRNTAIGVVRLLTRPLDERFAMRRGEPSSSTRSAGLGVR